jgi:integrase
MSPDSSFAALVDYWLEDMEMEDRLSRTTRLLYERNMRKLVLPYFENLTLREIGVARCDYFIKQLAKESYNRARQARVVMRLALALAVRHELIPRNPMEHVSRLRRAPREVNTFTPAEVQFIRAAIRKWEQRQVKTGPRPDGQLGQIVEVMLGTSARVGEVLAIRLCDLDLKSAIPTVRICGTIISRSGELTHRQDRPKTAQSVRRIALPRFAADAIRARLPNVTVRGKETLLFSTRRGTPHTTNNIRRRLRDVTSKAGIDAVTPHRFRRAVATAINDAAGIDLAAALLGHADTRVTQMHYVPRDEIVDAVTAQHLEEAFGTAG